MRNLFILRGVPGSGKSTWVKENELDSYTISADTLRLMYQSPVTNIDGTRTISQNHDSEVWKMVLSLMERRMQNGELIIVDATHYKSVLINKYKDLISKYRYRVYVVDFSDVSEEELKKRNKERGFRAVPEEVIDKMLAAIKDTSEVKKAYTIITPDEASALINSELQPYIIPENINKVVIFGDIHGCYDPLKYEVIEPILEERLYADGVTGHEVNEQLYGQCGILFQAILPMVATDYVRLFFDNFCLGLIRTVSLPSGIFFFFFFLIYAALIELLLWKQMRKRSLAVRLLLLLSLGMTLLHVAATSAVIMCLSRYVIYNTTFLYSAGFLALVEEIRILWERKKHGI